MGENSNIEWTDHTFNPWIGCTKVSPGCANCYAEREFDHRHHKAKWGAGQPRVRTSPGTWAQPLRWDRAAAKAGVRARVFCASLADVFDHEVDPQWRSDLFALISQCPHLDWLLLTKRPENMTRMLPVGWLTGETEPWPNVWLGTTVENQATANERVPHLLEVPARVRFLSCEPLLGLVNLRRVGEYTDGRPVFDALTGSKTIGNMARKTDQCSIGVSVTCGGPKIDWIICGGESGPHARPLHPSWVRSLRDQAQAAGVGFHFKQWGEWLPINQIGDSNTLYLPAPEHDPERIRTCRVETGIHHLDGMYQPIGCADYSTGAMQTFRVGKRQSGRILDGRTWDEVPA